MPSARTYTISSVATRTNSVLVDILSHSILYIVTLFCLIYCLEPSSYRHRCRQYRQDEIGCCPRAYNHWLINCFISLVISATDALR